MFFDQFSLFVWKEYRTQRFVWGIAFVVGVLLEFAFDMFFNDRALWVPLVIPVFYAIACGATLFANERETRTSDWLLALSASPAPLLCAKLGVAFLSTLLLQLALAICEVGLYFCYPAFMRTDLWNLATMIYPMALVQLIWSVLGSLISRRTLFSVGATVFWQCVLVVVPLSLVLNLSRSDPHAGERAISYVYVFMTCLVALADVWLGWRWCQGKYIDGTVLDRAQAFLNQRTGERRVTVPLWRRVPKQAEYDRDWKRSWQRLVWQERHRESLHLFLLAIGCIAGPLLILMDVVVIRMLPGEGGFKLLALFGCLVTPCMIGVLAFETDPDQQQLRFLNSRGVSPLMLWLAKQVVWFPRAVVITTVIAVVCWFSFFQMTVAMGHGDQLQRVMITQGTNPLPSLAFWYTVLGYACGQLASVVFKRPIVAMIIGLALTVFVDFWTTVALSAPIPSGGYLWIILILAMLFSLLQIRARMSEQPVWKRRLQLLTSSVGITVAMVALLDFATRSSR